MTGLSQKQANQGLRFTGGKTRHWGMDMVLRWEGERALASGFGFMQLVVVKRVMDFTEIGVNRKKEAAWRLKGILFIQ